MDRRIAAPKGKGVEALLERLTTKLPGEDFALFETKQKALMFAAAFGRSLDRRDDAAPRDSGSAIRFDIFEKAYDDSFVLALGIATANELRVLEDARQDELFSTFEAYVAAGLSELDRRCFHDSLDPLDAVTTLVLAAREVLPVATDGLSGMDDSVLRGLLS